MSSLKFAKLKTHKKNLALYGMNNISRTHSAFHINCAWGPNRNNESVTTVEESWMSQVLE